MGGVTQFVSNVNDSLMSLTDPVGNTTSWISNWRGQPLVETDPRGKQTHYGYDPTGRVVSIKDRRNRDRIFGYFTNGWLASDAWYESQIEIHSRTWTWWEDGQMKTAAGNGGTYTWDIDELGRRTSQTDIHGLTLDYTWDDGDRLTDINESVDNGLRQFQYYDNNMLKNVQFSATGWQSLRFDFTYDNRNWMKDVKRYSDLAGTALVATTAYQYYKDAQIKEIKHTDNASQVINQFNYNYDAAHRVASETAVNGPDPAFGYDDTDQLTGDGTNTYQWDKNGNPTDSGWSVSAGNQLDSDGVWNYEYFDDGSLKKKTNIATGEVWEFEYDHLDHLTLAEHRPSAAGAVDKRVQFQYDVLGNRFERTVDLDGDGPGAATTEKYAYENGNAWADLDGLGNITARRLYLDGLDSLFARISSGGEVGWYLTDKLGSVRDMVDGAGASKVHRDYDSFGSIVTDSDPANFGDRYGYTSREWDDLLDLQYNRERFYDPLMRRFISQDPIGFEAGDANLNRYVGNGPTNATDPTGEIICAGVCIAIGAAIVVGAVIGMHYAAERYDYAGEHYLGTSADEWTPEMRAEFQSYVGTTQTIQTVSETAGYVGLGVATAGGASALAGAGLAATMGGGAVTGMVVNGTSQVADIRSGYQDGFDVGQFVASGVAGAVGGGLTRGMSGLAGRWGVSQGWSMLGRTGFRLGGGFVDGALTDAAYQGTNMLFGSQSSYNVGQTLAAGTFGAALGLFMRTCFTGETPILAQGGSKRADEIQEGDFLWSQDEFDPKGEPALKQVEEVFVRVAPIVNLHVNGRIIRTTAEHPFYVVDKGWIRADQLQEGDLLQSHDKKLIHVEGVADSGEVTTVYNFRVADYHTYFVGSEAWGFNVWAHNAGYGNSYASKKPATLYELVDRSTGDRLKWGISNNPARRYTNTFLDKIKARLVPIMSGARKRMAEIERSLVMQEPGPLNHEHWAGAMNPR